jgi:hypothetical protein
MIAKLRLYDQADWLRIIDAYTVERPVTLMTGRDVDGITVDVE